MSKTGNSTEQDLKERFALSPVMDLEIDACGEGWVGIAPHAPHRLRQDITASVIAAKLGYSSVDYVRKSYLDNMDPHAARDVELRALASSHVAAYDQFYRAFDPPRENAPLGVFAFDLAVVRARASLELLVIVSRQGFLIESALIARSLLEQFAYAAYVWNKVDDHEIFEAQPQNLMRHLRVIRPSSGKAYGLLSKLAHYNPKDHYHFIGESDGSQVNQRSWRFKIVASAWTFYIFDVLFSVFKQSYGGYDNFSLVEGLAGSSIKSFDRHFSGVEDVWVRQVRALMNDRSS
jgi:hypothetical protein